MSRELPEWFKKQQEAQAKSGADPLRKEALRVELAKRKAPPRAEAFAPYLLVRSRLGDKGDRAPAIDGCFWESPDIWTTPGAPGATAVPPGRGPAVVGANTVYAHVWNLGFAPLAGVWVEFFSMAAPALLGDGVPTPIGTARCELSARGMPGSHKLVKCSNPWTPAGDGVAHESLIVRVSGLGDPVGANALDPRLNRHVAQRSVSVVHRDWLHSGGPTRGNIVSDLARLRNALPLNFRMTLVQLGAPDAELPRHLVAPDHPLAPLPTRTPFEIPFGINNIAALQNIIAALLNLRVQPTEALVLRVEVHNAVNRLVGGHTYVTIL